MQREDIEELKAKMMDKIVMKKELKEKYQTAVAIRQKMKDKSIEKFTYLRDLLENIVLTEKNPNKYELSEKAHAIIDKIKGE